MAATKDTDTTSSELSAVERSASLRASPSRADVVTSDDVVDLSKLARVLKKDRLRLKMTWPHYAEHMGVPLSTLYKIARGDSHPHELTVQTILDRWELLSATPE